MESEVQGKELQLPGELLVTFHGSIPGIANRV